jgi:WhiB family redox-sensing transcriptional regulator
MKERDEEFEKLIERSSLGTSGARQLRGRTPSSQVEIVRRIVDLRNRMVHSGASESTQAATALIQFLRDLGYEGQAQRVLAEVFPARETENVVRTAQIISGSLHQSPEEHVKSATELDLTAEEPTSADCPTRQASHVEHRRLVLNSLILENSGSATGSGTATALLDGGTLPDLLGEALLDGGTLPDLLDGAELAHLLETAPSGPEMLPCRSHHDPDLWFSESPAELEQAKQLCSECPIRLVCLDSALSRQEPWGVWGGEIFEHGAVIPRKRPRGRPSKAALERERERAERERAERERAEQERTRRSTA